jgi:hypothetical protein
MYTISTRFGPASLTARPRSAGGAVPAFFFRPFVFAVSVVPFTRISHVGGNSIGACSAVARYVLGVWYVDDVQYSRSWYFGLPARREHSERVRRGGGLPRALELRLLVVREREGEDRLPSVAAVVRLWRAAAVSAGVWRAEKRRGAVPGPSTTGDTI